MYKKFSRKSPNEPAHFLVPLLASSRCDLKTDLGDDAAVPRTISTATTAKKTAIRHHKTKDPHYVKDFLGHKSLKNTEIYINIENTLFEPTSDEFTVRVIEKPEAVKALLEVGFEYICQKDSLIFLRKRK